MIFLSRLHGSRPKIYLDNVRRGKYRERKRERRRERRTLGENLFKSGRKNPLGTTDLPRVRLDVSNERPALWEKLCSNGSSKRGRPCRPFSRDALGRCPYTWTRGRHTILMYLVVRYGFVNWSNGRSFPPLRSTDRGFISFRSKVASQPPVREKKIRKQSRTGLSSELEETPPTRSEIVAK